MEKTEASFFGRLTVIILMAMMLLTLTAGIFDGRTLNGISVWTKPTKFFLSFALHVATLLIFLSFLRVNIQKSRTIRWTLSVICAAVLLELSYIALQAARGRASHFNRDTRWEEFAYYGMGAAVVVVMIGTVIIGVAVWRGARSEIGPGLRTGVVLGATLGTLATLVTAGAMSSMQLTPTGHWVGGDLTDATGLPMVGWSTTGGDLRAPHFFATHLIQTLPIVGWLSDRMTPSFARGPVWLAAIVGLIIVGATFGQALDGTPLIGSNVAP
jgi:hypothetical protein